MVGAMAASRSAPARNQWCEVIVGGMEFTVLRRPRDKDLFVLHKAAATIGYKLKHRDRLFKKMGWKRGVDYFLEGELLHNHKFADPGQSAYITMESLIQMAFAVAPACPLCKVLVKQAERLDAGEAQSLLGKRVGSSAASLGTPKKRRPSSSDLQVTPGLSSPVPEARSEEEPDTAVY